MSQKGYLIAEAKVSDPAAYEGYKLLAERAIAQYGGRYLVRGGAVEMLDMMSKFSRNNEKSPYLLVPRARSRCSTLTSAMRTPSQSISAGR